MVNSRSEDFKMIFVVGCPRSGTYLLVSRLNGTGQIAIPVESHFIPLFNRVRFLWGNLAVKNNRRRLCLAIYDFLEIWTPRSERGRNLEKIRKISLLATRPFIEEIVGESDSYTTLVSAMFRKYAQLHHAAIGGDKSAFFSHVPLEQIDNILPDVRFIHMVRDCRDVALSWKKLWVGPKTLAVAALEWKRHVLKKRDWGCRHSGRYLEVKYEDMLSDHEVVIRRIMQFACPGNGDLSEAGFDGDFARILSQGSAHGMLDKPLRKDNMDKWKTQMKKQDIAFVEYVAGDALKKCGYEITSARLTCVRRIFFGARVLVSRIADALTLRQFRLFVKGSLPLLIFLSRNLKISLPTLVNRRRLST